MRCAGVPWCEVRLVCLGVRSDWTFEEINMTGNVLYYDTTLRCISSTIIVVGKE